jgi:hypothetical protein
MDKILDFLTKNWETLKSAPLIFISFLLLAFALAFVVANYIYKERIETLKERLTSKDDQINEYRQRLHLVDTDKTAYSQLTNQELRGASAKPASRLREYVDQREQQDMRRLDASRLQMLNAKSEEERQRVWNAETSTLLTSPTLNSEYSAKFLSDAILLRDELLSRLPKEQKNPSAYSIYEYPTNPIGLRMVIEDLKRLSKNLPK